MPIIISEGTVTNKKSLLHVYVSWIQMRSIFSSEKKHQTNSSLDNKEL